MRHDEFTELLYEDINKAGIEVEDPELRVVGLGDLRLSFIKQRIKEIVAEIDKNVRIGNWNDVQYHAFRNGSLKAYLDTVLKYEKDLENRAN